MVFWPRPLAYARTVDLRPHLFYTSLMTAKDMVLNDLRRCLTYQFTDGTSGADRAASEEAIDGFLREAGKHDAKELARWLDPPDKAVTRFLGCARAKGTLKAIWH